MKHVKMDLLPPGRRLGAADEVGAAARAAAEVGPAAAGAVAVAGAPPPPRAPAKSDTTVLTAEATGARPGAPDPIADRTPAATDAA